MKFLTHNATIQCACGAAVKLKKLTMPSWTMGDSPIVTVDDFSGAVITDCPLKSPSVPCTSVAQLIVGDYASVDVNGQTPVLDSMQALTNGTPPNICSAVDDGASAAELIVEPSSPSLEKQAVSIALDMLPVSGTVKSGVELLSGEDPITSEKVSKVAAIIGLIPIIGKFIGKVMKRVAKLYKKVPEDVLTHWNKHRLEFPEFENAEQYFKHAEQFVKGPPPGTERIVRPSDDAILFFHRATNTFVVKHANGKIGTMFRPAKKVDYWKRQVEQIEKGR